MKAKLPMVLAILFVLTAAMALSGCTSPTVTPTATPTGTPVTKTVALNVSGMVDNPLVLSMQELLAYPNTTIATAGKNNTTVTATGVSLNKLLDDAKPKAGATNVTFTAADGYSKTVSLADIRAANESIVAFEGTNALRDIIPGKATSYWVGNANASLSSIVVS